MSSTFKKLCYGSLILFSLSILFTKVSSANTPIEGIQIYHQNPLSLEKKQKLAADIYRFRNADNIWEILREEFVLAHYEDHPAVQDQIEFFMNNQDYLLRSASRAAPYLYFILQQVRKRHLPVELVLLPIMESGYNPFAYSSAGASGLWQMMAPTASGYGIKADWWYDGRRDVIASTKAALNHLVYLQSFFDGNWLLALAAYDTGEGNVQSAIRRNIRAGKKTDFWSLPVAQETRTYVPRLLALATIISHPEQYPIYFPPVRNAPYLAQIEVGAQLNLKHAASLAGISLKNLKQLNPGFSQPSTSPHKPTQLVLPIENVEQFVENLARTPLKPPINWIHYRVKTGDTLPNIAKKFNTTPEIIRKLNHLTKNVLRPKSNLLIPRDNTAETALLAENNKASQKEEAIFVASRIEEKTTTITKKIIKTSRAYVLKPGDTVYMVRNKDSLENLARRFHVDIDQLRYANNFTNRTNLKPGKQIIIPTHERLFLATTQSTQQKISPNDTVYMVRRGDTIEKIAKKFRLSAASLRVANLLKSNQLQEGDRLVIPTHLRG